MMMDRTKVIALALSTSSIVDAVVLIASNEFERVLASGGKETVLYPLFEEFFAKRGSIVFPTEDRPPEPVPIRLTCPACGVLHIDEGEFATRPHKSHTCQSCGMTWMPALVPTVGVRFLPGTNNSENQGEPK